MIWGGMLLDMFLCTSRAFRERETQDTKCIMFIGGQREYCNSQPCCIPRRVPARCVHAPTLFSFAPFPLPTRTAIPLKQIPPSASSWRMSLLKVPAHAERPIEWFLADWTWDRFPPAVFNGPLVPIQLGSRAECFLTWQCACKTSGVALFVLSASV